MTLSATRSDLTTCVRITDRDLAQAVRNLARTEDLEPIYREAAVLAAVREDMENWEKQNAAG